jgi:hypothetical protein
MRDQRYWWTWCGVFALVFGALVWSTWRFARMEFLPSRFLDEGRSRLERGDGGATLHLVVREVPVAAALDVHVQRDAEPPRVVLEWAAGTRLQGPREDRSLAVPVPDAGEILVLDERWGRAEAIRVRRGGGAPGRP